MTKDWVRGVGHSPVCKILLQIVVRVVITSSPPAWTISAGTLSTPADFPFFSDCTAASASLRRMGWSSSVSVWGQFSTDGSPLALLLYSSEVYSVHRFSICRSSVRHFPERSLTVVAFPFHRWLSLSPVGMPYYSCSSSDFLQSHNTVLLSSFLLPFSCTNNYYHHVEFDITFIISIASEKIATLSVLPHTDSLFAGCLTVRPFSRSA